VTQPNCQLVCATPKGCVLGDDCPHLPHLQKALDFIRETSWPEIYRLAAINSERVQREQP
jgi:hypothetical protein